MTKERLFAGQSFGEYEILASPHSAVESGSFGRVYKARHRVTGAVRALKILRTDKPTNEAILAMFAREVAVLRAVAGPGVPVVYEEGCVNDVPFFVQEWIEGETIDSYLTRGSYGRTPHAVMKIIDPLAKVLGRVHRHGYVHRDLAPCNIMRRSSGEIVLIDFGLACRKGEVVLKDEAFGNAYYLSPEQADQQEAHPAHDEFSLGVLAYELVTGENPLRGYVNPRVPVHPQIQVRSLLKQRAVRIPPIHSFLRAATVPSAFAEAIERAVSLEQSHRFPTVEGFRRCCMRASSLPALTPAESLLLHAAAKLLSALS